MKRTRFELFILKFLQAIGINFLQENMTLQKKVSELEKDNATLRKRNSDLKKQLDANRSDKLYIPENHEVVYGTLLLDKTTNVFYCYPCFLKGVRSTPNGDDYFRRCGKCKTLTTIKKRSYTFPEEYHHEY